MKLEFKVTFIQFFPQFMLTGCFQLMWPYLLTVPLTGLLQENTQIQKPGLELAGTETRLTGGQYSFPCPGTMYPSFLFRRLAGMQLTVWLFLVPNVCKKCSKLKRESCSNLHELNLHFIYFSKLIVFFSLFYFCLVVCLGFFGGFLGGFVDFLVMVWGFFSSRSTIWCSLPRQNSSLSMKGVGDWDNGHEGTPERKLLFSLTFSWVLF